MITTYALILARCGLSHREAANVHNVRLDTVKSWATGRNNAPAGAINELRTRHAQIERAAGEGIAQIAILTDSHGQPDAARLTLSNSDADAQTRGWPCVGAHAAVLGLIAARAAVPVEVERAEG